MPIRIRKLDKSTITLPSDALFIEILNDSGEVMGVVHPNKINDSVNIFDGSSIDKSLRYSKYYGVKFTGKNYHINTEKITLK